LRCVLSVVRFEQGRWVHIKVHIDDTPETEAEETQAEKQ
jgi:hypothetical protein